MKLLKTIKPLIYGFILHLFASLSFSKDKMHAYSYSERIYVHTYKYV